MPPSDDHPELIEATHAQWKQACEGLARGDIGPLEQCNCVDGQDCIREYLDNGVVVMRMRVADSNTDKPGYECGRTYELAQPIVGATEYVYIPTEEEYEAWSEQENDTGESVIEQEIAKREAQP